MKYWFVCLCFGALRRDEHVGCASEVGGKGVERERVAYIYTRRLRPFSLHYVIECERVHFGIAVLNSILCTDRKKSVESGESCFQ